MLGESGGRPPRVAGPWRVEGVEVAALGYNDRTLVLATGSGRVGHVVQASRDKLGGTSWEVRTLLGGATGRGPELELWARRVAERLASKGHRKDLLLCAGPMQGQGPALLDAIVRKLEANPVW